MGYDQLSSHYKDIEGYSLDSFINELPFYLGNIMKYAWRAPHKNGIDDTVKLLDYLDMSHHGWVEYNLSVDAIRVLSEISSRDFYSESSVADMAHRRCIASAAEWVLISEGSPGSDYESERQLILSVASLQVSLLHN
nr:MAG TPA: nucelotide kinase [Caudoviricetes sp.]